MTPRDWCAVLGVLITVGSLVFWMGRWFSRIEFKLDLSLGRIRRLREQNRKLRTQHGQLRERQEKVERDVERVCGQLRSVTG